MAALKQRPGTQMYELPELPYGYDALGPHVSRELFELHHDAHHAAYVKGANDTLAKLEDARHGPDSRRRRVEHAYYLQFRNKKAAWLDAFWQLVNWTDVAQRFTKVRKTDIGL